MTNYEYYKDELIEKLARSRLIIIDDKPATCDNSCPKCECNSCAEAIRKWLNAEYTVDWSKVPQDTPIYVSSSGTGDVKEWVRRYFAYYKDNKVYAYSAGSTSWTACEQVSPWDYAVLAEEQK